MSQFYGSISGNASVAARVGNKESGMSGHICGHAIGVETHVYWNDTAQRDEVKVVVTNGKNLTPLCGFTAYRDDGMLVRLETDSEFLCMIDDAVFLKLFAESSAFVKQMQRLLFLHMDKLG